MKKKLISLLSLLLIAATFHSFLYCQEAMPRVLGVVMGISKYQNVPSLQYADRDAMSFYNFLLSPAGGKADTNNIRLLLNEKATSYNFFEAMDNLLDMAKENDVVYVYFAGHGDIEKKTERQNGFLIGYNAPPNCYAAGGCISVKFLQDYVETLVSKNKSKVVLIVDACRSGKLAGGQDGAEITALALKAEWKGVVKILSCQPGEVSFEGEKWGDGSGVFTYFMLRGLKGMADEDGDGKITIRELYNFMDKNVPVETGNKQIPEIIGDRRFEIATVDKKTYTAMLNQAEKPVIIADNYQSTGLRADINSLKDVSVIKAYEKFKYFIQNNNLIAYNDADIDKENAFSIYKSIEKNKSAAPIINSMKGELLAALQNRAQISLNKYLNSEFSLIRIVNMEDSITRNMTYLELKTALSIADSTYSQYNQIKFRYLFYSHTLEKDSDKRMKILDECMNLNPDEPVIYNAIGLIKHDMKNIDEALNYFKMATELAPSWVWSLNNISMTLIDLGKYEVAIKYCDKAIEINPRICDSWNYKGYAFIIIEKNEEAIKYFDKAIELTPDNFYAWNNKGWALNNLGKYEEAIKCLDKAIELNPDYLYAWQNKGKALINLGKNEEAIKFFDKAIELKPDEFSSWYNKGTILNNIKKYEEAVKCYDKAIELKPDDYSSWYKKGIILNNEGKYEEAIICFDKVIELKPGEFSSWYNKGIIFNYIGKYEEAVKCYDKALELKHDNNSAWQNKGNALINLGKNEEAIICYDKAIEIKSDDVDAWVGKGNSLLFLNKHEEAIKCYDKVIELAPKNPIPYYNLACAYSKLKNKTEMLNSLKKAIELNPQFKIDAPKDQDFKEYWEDPDFKKITE